jgi:flagellar motor switch protein FliN/FliY
MGPENSGGAGSAALPGAETGLPNKVEEMIDHLSTHGGGVAARKADFAELDMRPSTGGASALDNLLDVTVSVTAELGRATTSIGQLLKLNVGSVVELERLISDPVDLVAQGIRLARGEVVVVEDRFAIRIQEIVDPRKRV